MPKNAYPSHWKGDRGLYCAGLARRGLFGVKMDAEAIVEDINQNLKRNHQGPILLVEEASLPFGSFKYY